MSNLIKLLVFNSLLLQLHKGHSQSLMNYKMDCEFSTFKTKNGLQLEFKGFNNQLLFAPSNKAFFCRLEDRIQKSKKIKPSFRLGSLNYSNLLEYGSNSWNVH